MSDFKFKPTTTLWRIKTLLKNDSNVFVISFIFVYLYL